MHPTMKAILIFLSLCLTLTGKNLTGQGIVISENGTAVPDGSALLDIQSSIKGLLVPRMSTTDRLSIVNPANGLLVFDNLTGKFHYMNTSWHDIVYNGFPDLTVGHLGSTSITTTGDLLMSGNPSLLKFNNGNDDIIWLDQSGSNTIYFSSTNKSWAWRYQNTTTAYLNMQTGYLYAPRFYDHSNIAYFIDPAGYSYLNSAIYSGNVGIGVTLPINECLEVALPGSRGTILVSDGGGSERYGLKLASPGNAITYSLIESTKYGTGAGGQELQINTQGGGLTIFGGDIIPDAHFSNDLGSSSQAWDDVYADDFQNITVMCFNNRSVTSEILNYAPIHLSQSREIDYFIDPSSLPPGLSTKNAVNLGNLSAYNYTVNYEQQIQIEQLKKENEELRTKIDWLMKQMEIMKQTH